MPRIQPTRSAVYLFLFIGLLTSLIIFSSCGQKHKKNISDAQVSNVQPNAIDTLGLDASMLADYLNAHPAYDSLSNLVADHYKTRAYRPIWLTAKGAKQAERYTAILNDYLSFAPDSSIIDSLPIAAIAYLRQEVRSIREFVSHPAQVEFALTLSMARMLAMIYGGQRKFDIKRIGWYIKPKSISLMPLIDSLTTHPSISWLTLAPRHPQCDSLLAAIRLYSDIARQGGFNKLPYFPPKLSLGQRHPLIVQLKQRLYEEKMYSVPDTSTYYDRKLSKLIRRLRTAHGMSASNIIDSALIRMLNRSISDRLRQLWVNHERFCWLPYSQTADSIVVNIPDYHLYVYQNGRIVRDMRVVVGKKSDPTQVFRSRMRTIVFSSYWYVPSSIVKKEIMPLMAKDPAYLERHNMEITARNAGIPSIRQLPGAQNALGRVKFLFPNSFGIYLHDTPSKRFFDYRRRAYSHGCIRLSQPDSLAIYLLRNDPLWSSTQITRAMEADKEKIVAMKEAITVMIVYFTSWVNAQGQIQWREDIYDHDKVMAEILGLMPPSTNS